MPLILTAIFCFILTACGPSSDSHEYRVKEFLSEIEQNPEDPSLHIELGKIYIEEKKYYSALKTLAEAIRLKEDHGEAYRQKGIAGKLVQELVDVARMAGLQKVEAEFIDKQEGGQKLFALLGFTHLLKLEDYVQDMQAINHDYVLMGMDLKTDEEYAGMG